jgi:ABC-type iron transport system FetAB ATPase subunit
MTQAARIARATEPQSAAAGAASTRLVIEARAISLTFAPAGCSGLCAVRRRSRRRGGCIRVADRLVSSCGKTTLLRIIADLEKATSGSITVNGVDPQTARRRRDYGYVFQAPARTVIRNVMLPLEVIGMPTAERRERALRNLELVRLRGFERKYPWQLSGGMQQRASIARALAFDPKLLLMDEPFGALDEIVRDKLRTIIQRVHRSDCGSDHGTSQRCASAHKRNSTRLNATSTTSPANACGILKNEVENAMKKPSPRSAATNSATTAPTTASVVEILSALKI